MDVAQNDRARILTQRLLTIDWAAEQEFNKERPSKLLLDLLQGGLAKGGLAKSICEYQPDLGKDLAESQAEEYFARIRWNHERATSRN